MPTSAHPYFGVPAARYFLNGENVYAFEYSLATEAAVEAGRISPDGFSIGNTQVSWISEPHFYRSGSVIVLYVGTREDTVALLASVIGPQIAGG